MGKSMLILGVLFLGFAGLFLRARPLPEYPLPPSAVPAVPMGMTADTLIDGLPDILRSPSALGEVEFPHRFHFDDLELACTECHHETNAAVLDFPHEDYFDDFWIDCAICHRASGEITLQPQACSTCHPAGPRDTADETLSAKVVIHMNCWSCHETGTGAEASENCKTCHVK